MWLHPAAVLGSITYVMRNKVMGKAANEQAAVHLAKCGCRINLPTGGVIVVGHS